MTHEPAGPLKTTRLHPTHQQRGARMIPFGDWDMPAQYACILKDHRVIRSQAGLFDVSRRGEILAYQAYLAQGAK